MLARVAIELPRNLVPAQWLPIASPASLPLLPSGPIGRSQSQAGSSPVSPASGVFSFLERPEVSAAVCLSQHSPHAVDDLRYTKEEIRIKEYGVHGCQAALLSDLNLACLIEA